MKKLSFIHKIALGFVAFVIVAALGMYAWDYGKVLPADSPEVKDVVTAVDSVADLQSVKVSDLREVKDSTGNYVPVQYLYYTTDSGRYKRVVQLNLTKKWWKYRIGSYVVKH